MTAFARLAVLTLAFVLALAGCADDTPQFSGIDVTGAEGYANDFRLTDHNGKTRTMADFRGKVVAVFFGFTQCPDVCPTTMADLRKVMRQLGPDADKVQVLFITLDPKRDTQEILGKYVPSFHPSFLGLYGDEAATEKTARDFKIFYQQRPGKTPETYTLDHTAGTLVFDQRGRLRLFHNYGLSPEAIASDFRLLFKQG